MAIIIAGSGCAEEDFIPEIVAHRGASRDAPENTIPAFMLAWEQGADAIEGDFFLTADGEIVCIHDRRTGRVAGKDLVVKDSSLEELRQLDVGAWKGEEWNGTVIPTLTEIFEIVPDGKKIFVEIKDDAEILPVLYEDIDRSGLREDQVVIICFNSGIIKEFKSTRPEHKAFWLSGFSEDESGNIVPKIESVLETLEYIGADGFSSNFRHIDQDYIDRIIDAGYEYHVWTVNETEVAFLFSEYGAKSVTTDKPGEIRDFLTKKGGKQ